MRGDKPFRVGVTLPLSSPPLVTHLRGVSSLFFFLPRVCRAPLVPPVRLASPVSR